MDIHNSVTFVVGLITIFTAIYKLAQIESSINSKIANLESNLNSRIANLESANFLTVDNLKDKLNDKLINLDRKVDIHLQDYTNYKEAILLQHNGLFDAIKHNWSKTEKLFNSERQKS
ncbi:MAG: hypothetical protein V7L23_33400 [Nostoc sp.]|uniref:hypothetical protein n=1 Tax=Nostoc sp. TaxID=1180 RepID=UPI002FEF35F6